MVYLTVDNLYKEYQGEKVTNPLTFSVKDNDRVALLGINVCGKTTLLKMLTSEIEKSGGSFSFNSDIKVGYLSQSIISNLENTLYDEMLSCFSELISLEEELKNLSVKISQNYEDTSLLEKYSHKETLFLNKGGYNFEYQILTVLTMFNFSKEDYSKKIKDFSGGERSKISFCKLLLLKPDMLLLDEPTNHLDVSTIEWLETYLSTYSGAILFVTHDVSFIKALSNKVMEIENKDLEIYNGNYDYYLKEKKLRYEQKLALYTSQQKERDKLKRFIEFYMPKPRFVSRAHDREKKLARLEKNMIDKPLITKNKVHIDFKGETRYGKTLIKFKDVAIGYDNFKLVDNINFTLYGQDHLVIMGDNGTGKTTFIKTLLNNIPLLEGKIETKENFSIGYLEQDFRNISVNKTIFDYIKDRFVTMLDQDIYNHLGKYKFNYEDANTKLITSLSGGEMMRLQLCILALETYDILLLDEPTNHLDIFSKNELIDSINEYAGSVIVISHDRDFINKISNKILYFYNKKAYFYDGSYDEFKKEILTNLINKTKEETNLLRKKEEKKNLIKESNNNINNESIYKKKQVSSYKYDKLIKSIDRLEKKNEELKSFSFLEEYYSSVEKMQSLKKEIETNEKEIESLYSKLIELEQ